MMGKSYIDISKCSKRYFDSLDGSDDEYHISDYNSESNNEYTYNYESDITYREDIILTLYIRLQQYFNIEENRTKLLDILSSNSNNLIEYKFLDVLSSTSNSLLERKFLEDLINNVEFEYPIEIEGDEYMFNSNKEYTKMLDKYGESHFNFNTTINTIKIGDRDGTTYYTSIGQLNFYKWFFDNVHNYANAPYIDFID